MQRLGLPSRAGRGGIKLGESMGLAWQWPLLFSPARKERVYEAGEETEAGPYFLGLVPWLWRGALRWEAQQWSAGLRGYQRRSTVRVHMSFPHFDPAFPESDQKGADKKSPLRSGCDLSRT